MEKGQPLQGLEGVRAYGPNDPATNDEESDHVTNDADIKLDLVGKLRPL